MVSEKVTVVNPSGLHLRPAGIFCNKAMEYRCQIQFSVGHTTGNAKSVLSVLGACIKCGDELTIICSGPDEEEALAAMTDLVASGIGD